MAYIAPFISASGLTINQYADILNYLIAAYRAIYGATVNLDPDSADYQDISIRALQAADVNFGLQIIYLSLNPVTAIGPSLDFLGKLIGPPRKPAANSTAVVTIGGTPRTVINNGVCQDTTGNYWNLPATTTIGVGGTVNVTAVAQLSGSIQANPGAISVIASPTFGWSSVTNAEAASIGQPVESDSAYRARLLISQALPSITLLAGTAAAVAALPGVTRSQVYENPTGSTDANGLPAHSISVVVEGGVDASVALAIYKNKGIGPDTYGSTAVVVVDPSNGSLAQTINFYRLTYLKIFVSLSIHALPGYSTAIGAAIINDIVAYLNGFTIGEDVVYSEVYSAAVAANLNSNVPTFAMRSFVTGYLAAETTATLNATTTIVVASNTGIANGQAVVGTGIPVGTTVTGVSGTNISISAAATVSASLVDVEFFTLVAANTDIAVVFNQAALGLVGNVQLSLV